MHGTEASAATPTMAWMVSVVREESNMTDPRQSPRRIAKHDEQACNEPSPYFGDPCILIDGHEGSHGARATIYPGLGQQWKDEADG